MRPKWNKCAVLGVTDGLQHSSSLFLCYILVYRGGEANNTFLRLPCDKSPECELRLPIREAGREPQTKLLSPLAVPDGGQGEISKGEFARRFFRVVILVAIL